MWKFLFMLFVFNMFIWMILFLYECIYLLFVGWKCNKLVYRGKYRLIYYNVLFVVYKEVFKLLNDYNVFFLKKKFGILILEKWWVF